MIRKAVFYTMVFINLGFLLWTYNTQVNILTELRQTNNELLELNTKNIFDKVELDILDLNI